MTKPEIELTPSENHIPLGKGVKFCLNCDDMEEIAFDPENGDQDVARARFNNCAQTGRFDGDFCSRLFVTATNGEAQELFDPEEEDDI